MVTIETLTCFCIDEEVGVVLVVRDVEELQTVSQDGGELRVLQ